MFRGCSNLQTLDMSAWNTRRVKDMNAMFAGCQRLRTLDFGPRQPHLSVNVRALFWGVPPTARVTINLNPWQWYLSNLYDLNAPGAIWITPTALDSPLMPQNERGRLSGHPASFTSFIGYIASGILDWQRVEHQDVLRLLTAAVPDPVLFPRLQAALNYLCERTVPALACTANCGTLTRKQWRDLTSDVCGPNVDWSTFQVGVQRPPEMRHWIDAAELREETEFQRFIATQNRAAAVAPLVDSTVLVAAMLHGAYADCNPSAAIPVPMFTIPTAKSLIIVSVATPGIVNYLDYEDAFLAVLRTIMQKPGFQTTMDRDPVHIAKELRDYVQDVKTDTKVGRERHIANSPAEYLALGPQNEANTASFVANYEHPRILYFKAGDNCIDKIFTADAGRQKWSRLLSLHVAGGTSATGGAAEVVQNDLMPPFQNTPTPTLRLSQLCHQMFTVWGHSTIILVDTSCSVFSDSGACRLAPADQKTMSADFFRRRLGGGRRVGRRSTSTSKSLKR